jgi:heat-inducible transcriptional repressor
MADVNKLRQLFNAFNRKRDILHLLDQAIQAQGVRLFIGEESGYEVLDECSVITSPYEAEGEIVGVVGVIGPTRMAYDRVIPVVDVAAKLLSTALNQAH